MGVNPLHLAGVQLDEFQTATFSCGVAWPQEGWQNADAVSREALADAIGQAEDELENALGWRLIPSWEVDERQPTVRPNRPELINVTSLDVRGYHQITKADWGHFISGGVRAKTVLGEARPIVYAETRGIADYEDEATVTAPVDAGTDPCEIRVYYPGKAADDRYEIRPITVVVAGTTATITFARELAVLDTVLENFIFEATEGTDDALFLTTVDVYRVFNDPQTQASFLWEPIGGNCDCVSTGSACPVCQFQTQTACLLYRDDPKLSLLTFQAGTWNAVTEQFDPASLSVGRNPDQLRLFYYAGKGSTLGCPRVEMDPAWAVVVSRLAAARLDRPPCACAQFWWERWSADLAFTTGAVELASYSMSPSNLANPFGTRRGDVYAWQQVNRPDVRAGGKGVVFA